MTTVPAIPKMLYSILLLLFICLEASITEQVYENVPPVGPDYIQKASEAARLELSKLLGSPDITKGEVQAKIESWATNQGGDILEAFKKHKKNQTRATMPKELSALNLTQYPEFKILIEDIEALVNDMSISKSDEREQIRFLVNALSKEGKATVVEFRDYVNRLAGFDVGTLALAGLEAEELDEMKYNDSSEPTAEEGSSSTTDSPD